MAASREEHVGILALQETRTVGHELRITQDKRHSEWQLHTGGSPTPSRSGGTGFLISPDFVVLQFVPVSPRVSWIIVCAESDRAKTHKAGFVCGYAPTEHDTPLEELQQFYSDLDAAVADAKRASRLGSIPVLGDFNIHLGSGLAADYPGIVGKNEVARPASKNSAHLMGFCERHNLVAVQTWRQAQVMKKDENWSTWVHPRTKKHHQKDLVLIPADDRTKVAVCRPHDHSVHSDHRWVLCKFIVPAVKRTWVQATTPSIEARPRGKLRRLDLAGSSAETRLQYQDNLSNALADSSPGWLATEQAMKIAAEKTLSECTQSSIHSWLTRNAHEELDSAITEVRRLQRLHRNPASNERVHPDLMYARRALRNCISKHKNIYRQKLANIAVRSGDAKKEGEALEILARGSDLSLQPPPRAKSAIDPTIFTAHFEQLFNKESDRQTLGLTEQTAGPKVPPRTELSGPPTLAEVQRAVKGLSRGTAPGSNGLRPELFKMGGDTLARRLVQDFGILWPTQEELDASAPSPPRIKVLQQWQDADVVTLYKMKGDPKDPGNYRGIFLLDVAGKVLASVINHRLKKLLQSSISDTQCGFRQNRSTGQLIHVIRRTQEACRAAGVKAYAVFIDFAKAFDSPPRAAIWECLEWSGCPPDLLAVIMAIHNDPRGKLKGSNACFRVLRGVRQGCVLGPTLFIIVLEYCLRLAGTEGTGIEFRCVGKGEIPLPPDLEGHSFSASDVEYADDCALLGTDPDGLSRALDRLQGICGSIGLDISIKKTEWIYLHNPDAAAMAACAARRQTGTCCELIKLGGIPITHSPKFNYLGSLITEAGGVSAETASRVSKATAALNRNSNFWSSPASIRMKCKALNTRVLPVLEYATECANHVQADIKHIDTFLNTCRHRILSISKWRRGWRRYRSDLLKMRCPLTSPLGLISPRRLAFAMNLLLRPGCQLARAMLFAEAVPRQGAVPSGSGRRSSYMRVLELDAR